MKFSGLFTIFDKYPVYTNNRLHKVNFTKHIKVRINQPK